MPNDTSKVEVEYVEFNSADLNPSDVVVGYGGGVNTNQTQHRTGLPAAGMPRRDHYFFGEVGGNAIANDNYTAYVSNTTNGTIFGRSGRYDKVAGGRKVYGNPTQGVNQTGNLTSLSEPNCQTRNLYLAVTAIQNQATLNIALSNVAFYGLSTANVTTSSANFLSMTLAAVLGLLSLAFF